MTHPEESAAPGIEDFQHLRFTWKWDETGYHGDDVSELLNFEVIDPQDAETIITSIEALRTKIQQVITIEIDESLPEVTDIDEESAQALLSLYNKLAQAHFHVKKFTASGAPEMPQINGVPATVASIRKAIQAVRAPVL
ncbi:hypothetical protein KA050_02550 [Candidatus Gracilibacteria bacterium]|jgi:hypothetical protein|nr:hypothetical protein [Candidatus Gracilibacteria bacterium]